MSNSEIRKRARDIFKEALVPLLLIHAFSSGAELIRDQVDSIIVAIVIMLISFIVNIGGFYMIMRGWIEGRMELGHLLIPFKSKVYSRKILPVMLMESLITGITAAPLIVLLIKAIQEPSVLFMHGAILILLTLLLIIVSAAISLVWYIYVLEPETKVTEMFRRSAVYMAHHWLDHFIFRLSIMIVPILVTVIMRDIIGETAISLLMIPADAYISVASMGYVYESILMVEKNKETSAQPVYVESVLIDGQTVHYEKLPPDQETIDELTEILTAATEKDIELELPVVDADTDDFPEEK